MNKKISNLALMIGFICCGAQGILAAPLLTQQISAQQPSTLQTNAWVEINVQAFENNIKAVQQQLKNNSQICAVLKADAYGHGIDLVMPSILKLKVPCVGITSNSEAALVRKHGYQGRIIRLRTATDNEIQKAASLNIEELIGNFEQVQRISKWAKSQNLTVAYHLALNAGGMDRNGLEMDSADGKQQALALTKLTNLKLTGIMTHYALRDEKFIRDRLALFNTQTKWLIKEAGLKREEIILHTASSFATLSVPEAQLDMVRTGGLLYLGNIPNRPEFKSLITVKTQVATINNYLKGSTVGYDQTHILTRNSRLVNLPVGFSDGYKTLPNSQTYVLIRGHQVPVVGRITMNTTMIDITDFPDIQAGDEVVLLGKQGLAEIKQDVYTIWGNFNPKVAVRNDID